MIAHVTDCADSIGAVSTRSPLSSVSRWKVVMGAMLSTSRSRAAIDSVGAVIEPVDEPHGLPIGVDRGRLVVDEAGSEADPLDRLEIEVGVDLRRLLRPRDPEP